MEKLTYLKIAEKILEQERKPLSAQEIWDIALSNGMAEQLEKYGKTPERSIGAQIYCLIRDNEDCIFYLHSSRPSKFYLSKYKYESHEINQEDSEYIKDIKFSEKDMHPLLVKFVNVDTHFKAYSMTISHEKSTHRKKGLNQWVHPDIVGVYFPFEKDLSPNALKLQKTLSLSSTKLFSFELKQKVDFVKYKEYYFQAVSNSSWAHEGYLVTMELDASPDFVEELQRLNNAFGIGIIKLDKDNFDNSEILFPAKAREILDWETINKLIEENPDFKDFIETVTKSCEINHVIKEKYDTIISDDEFEKYLISKGFI